MFKSKILNYEIIIVDTQSTDGTDKIINYFSNFKRIRFYKIKRKYRKLSLKSN